MKKILTLTVLLLVFQNQIAFGQPKNNERTTTEFAIESLEKVIMHSLKKTLDLQYAEAIADPAGLIILLGDLDSNPARQLLLDLLELYFGSALAEALSYAVLKQGKAIRVGLKELKSNPVQCSLLKKYPQQKDLNSITCLDINSRNSSAQDLIDLIDEDFKPAYDY